MIYENTAYFYRCEFCDHISETYNSQHLAVIEEQLHKTLKCEP